MTSGNPGADERYWKGAVFFQVCNVGVKKQSILFIPHLIGLLVANFSCLPRGGKTKTAGKNLAGKYSAGNKTADFCFSKLGLKNSAPDF
jgi:hypothetical protein